MKYLYNKNTLKICGTVCSNMTLEDEIKLNVIPNFGGDIEDYSVIETNIEFFHLEKENEKVVVVKDKVELIPKPKERTREEILQDRIEALEKSNAELMNLIMMQATPTK